MRANGLTLEYDAFDSIMGPNIRMSICFKFALAALCAAAPVAAEAGREALASSVVQADLRTGRLVRRLSVNPRLVQERVVPPRVVQPRVIAKSKAGGPVQVPEVTGSSVDDVVGEVAARHGVDPLLVHAVIHVESRYDRFALSPKGAQGLMQLIPSTARRFGVGNSFNTRQNIEGGVKYLRHLQDRYRDPWLVLAAYNAGEEAVERYRRAVPPYPETQNYVYLVAKRYGSLRRSAVAAQAPSARELAAEAEYRPVEAYIDDAGRLNLRTR